MDNGHNKNFTVVIKGGLCNENIARTRSSWLNCALRDDEAVYWVCMRRYQLVIDDTGSVEDIHAFIYCTKWRSGQVLPMPD